MVMRMMMKIDALDGVWTDFFCFDWLLFFISPKRTDKTGHFWENSSSAVGSTGLFGDPNLVSFAVASQFPSPTFQLPACMNSVGALQPREYSHFPPKSPI